MRGLLRIRRWLRRLQPSASILCYHRVTELKRDPQLLSVTPRHFAEQIDVLRRRYNVVRLQDWASDRYSPKRGVRDVIVTFDDGYADNVREALPILRAADCPATIFVTAGKIDDESEFWWDELERIFLATPDLPERLSLTIGDRDYVYQLASTAADEDSNERWHVLLGREPTARQATYLALCRLLRMVGEVER